MRIRNGFVSNSSSSSFIIKDKDDFLRALKALQQKQWNETQKLIDAITYENYYEEDDL